MIYVSCTVLIDVGNGIKRVIPLSRMSLFCHVITCVTLSNKDGLCKQDCRLCGDPSLLLFPSFLMTSPTFSNSYSLCFYVENTTLTLPCSTQATPNMVSNIRAPTAPASLLEVTSVQIKSVLKPGYMGFAMAGNYSTLGIQLLLTWRVSYC